MSERDIPNPHEPIHVLMLGPAQSGKTLMLYAWGVGAGATVRSLREVEFGHMTDSFTEIWRKLREMLPKGDMASKKHFQEAMRKWRRTAPGIVPDELPLFDANGVLVTTHDLSGEDLARLKKLRPGFGDDEVDQSVETGIREIIARTDAVLFVCDPLPPEVKEEAGEAEEWIGHQLLRRFATELRHQGKQAAVMVTKCDEAPEESLLRSFIKSHADKQDAVELAEDPETAARLQSSAREAVQAWDLKRQPNTARGATLVEQFDRLPGLRYFPCSAFGERPHQGGMRPLLAMEPLAYVVSRVLEGREAAAEDRAAAREAAVAEAARSRAAKYEAESIARDRCKAQARCTRRAFYAVALAFLFLLSAAAVTVIAIPIWRVGLRLGSGDLEGARIAQYDLLSAAALLPWIGERETGHLFLLAWGTLADPALDPVDARRNAETYFSALREFAGNSTHARQAALAFVLAPYRRADTTGFGASQWSDLEVEVAKAAASESLARHLDSFARRRISVARVDMLQNAWRFAVPAARDDLAERLDVLLDRGAEPLPEQVALPLLELLLRHELERPGSWASVHELCVRVGDLVTRVRTSLPQSSVAVLAELAIEQLLALNGPDFAAALKALDAAITASTVPDSETTQACRAFWNNWRAELRERMLSRCVPELVTRYGKAAGQPAVRDDLAQRLDVLLDCGGEPLPELVALPLLDLLLRHELEQVSSWASVDELFARVDALVTRVRSPLPQSYVADLAELGIKQLLVLDAAVLAAAIKALEASIAATTTPDSKPTLTCPAFWSAWVAGLRQRMAARFVPELITRYREAVGARVESEARSEAVVDLFAALLSGPWADSTFDDLPGRLFPVAVEAAFGLKGERRLLGLLAELGLASESRCPDVVEFDALTAADIQVLWNAADPMARQRHFETYRDKLGDGSDLDRIGAWARYLYLAEVIHEHEPPGTSGLYEELVEKAQRERRAAEVQIVRDVLEKVGSGQDVDEQRVAHVLEISGSQEQIILIKMIVEKCSEFSDDFFVAASRIVTQTMGPASPSQDSDVLIGWQRLLLVTAATREALPRGDRATLLAHVDELRWAYELRGAGGLGLGGAVRDAVVGRWRSLVMLLLERAVPSTLPVDVALAEELRGAGVELSHADLEALASAWERLAIRDLDDGLIDVAAAKLVRARSADPGGTTRRRTLLEQQLRFRETDEGALRNLLDLASVPDALDEELVTQIRQHASEVLMPQIRSLLSADHREAARELADLLPDTAKRASILTYLERTQGCAFFAPVGLAPFYASTLVTQADYGKWLALLDAEVGRRYRVPEGGPAQPVRKVPRPAAMGYAGSAGGRLPTFEEWSRMVALDTSLHDVCSMWCEWVADVENDSVYYAPHLAADTMERRSWRRADKPPGAVSFRVVFSVWGEGVDR